MVSPELADAVMQDVVLLSAVGVRVVLVENHETPLVTARLVFRDGSWTDPDGREGLAAVTLFGSTTLATVAFSVGVSLALGGIAQMLAPQPKFDGPQEEQQPSYVFNGAVNTTAQGQPVPVGYGRMIVGSAVIIGGFVKKEAGGNSSAKEGP
jgi:hypothetical protein